MGWQIKLKNSCQAQKAKKDQNCCDKIPKNLNDITILHNENSIEVFSKFLQISSMLTIDIKLNW